jgi:hypothetical protein
VAVVVVAVSEQVLLAPVLVEAQVLLLFPSQLRTDLRPQQLVRQHLQRVVATTSTPLIHLEQLPSKENTWHILQK